MWTPHNVMKRENFGHPKFNSHARKMKTEKKTLAVHPSIEYVFIRQTTFHFYIEIIFFFPNVKKNKKTKCGK